MAAWLAQSLRCPVEIERFEDAPAITQVRLERASGDIVLDRPDGKTAALRQPDQPEHRIALPIRQLRECLAEELRRLDADEVYGEVLQKGLARIDAMTVRDVVVHPDARVLAESVAARLLTHLVDVQSHRSPVHVVLTGGTVGIASLAAVAANPVRDAVDWSGVHLWWGDERFLPDGDPDRNETQARDALHRRAGRRAARSRTSTPMPGAQRRRRRRRRRRPTRTRVSCAGRPGAARRSTCCCSAWAPTGTSRRCSRATRRSPSPVGPTVGVHGSPKPPPERVSLTFEAIRAAPRGLGRRGRRREGRPRSPPRSRGAPVDDDTGLRRARHRADALAGRRRGDRGLGTPPRSDDGAAFPRRPSRADLWTRRRLLRGRSCPRTSRWWTPGTRPSSRRPAGHRRRAQPGQAPAPARAGRGRAPDPRDRHARRLQHAVARPGAAGGRSC